MRHADFSKLTGLEPIVSLSVVHWRMGADGWIFADGEGVIPDTVMVGTLVGDPPGYPGGCQLDRRQSSGETLSY